MPPAISVIMPSFLGEYDGAASNRTAKFKRAVQSFIDQNIPDSELIIVADGCEKTHAILQDKFNTLANFTKVHWVPIPKQEKFSGAVRNAGIDRAHSDIICYLDTDDILLPGHLQAILDNFTYNIDWVYYNDKLAFQENPEDGRERGVGLTYGSIGTSAIAHRKSLNVRWEDGYGHDWQLVETLINRSARVKKISGAGYLVCHRPGQEDF